MKKLIGILVLTVTLSTANLNANTTNTLEEVGVGGCFGVWTFVYDNLIASGHSTVYSYDLANIAFNGCVSQQQ